MLVSFKDPDDAKQKLEFHHSVLTDGTVQLENQVPLP